MCTPDFDSWEFHPTHHPQDLAEREKYYEDLRLRFMQEVRTSEAANAFFAEYEPTSTEVFISKYATAKAEAVRYAHLHIKRIEGTREIEFPNDTRDAYDAILQKKLFNLQLEWRANRLDLRPHVEVSDDFIYWGEDLRRCPFLEPATADEIETMRAYLRQPFFDYRGFTRDQFHQYYRLYRAESGLSDEIPDWYNYYDLRHGTSALALLPDTRGQIEQRYVDVAQEKRKVNAVPVEPYVPPPPYLHASFKDIIAFAHATDHPCFEAIFRQQKHESDERQRAEKASGVYNASDIVVYLANIRNPPLVPRAGVSWQQAAADVWNAYMAEAVATDLALEGETYELYRLTGVHSTDSHEHPHLSSKVGSREEVRKWKVDLILEGRELLGEPRDLDIF